ncbi:outer membrane lipid asymmetry maintenance protein MlaD [Ferrimonas marina]|uniref:Phospholipid/cholesterol/gamma-HCH transport system substrate-binding protein n=1 Tax=Ferrimonas marina TaxID=299255 RepID=A0A1M5Y217_9GAMM|nr:outer membrane lipid asymmetry maintenance protein MlaD [Ferrimonas marina]SHI06052.1 phospholipid/cholesterol/gamma-HCH transport system substrate-binding protein [Ferrimonas marina]
MNSKKTELAVGAFLLAGLVAFLVLVFKVANIDPRAHNNTYQLEAHFDNIGSLKVRSPVKVGGVVVGRVTRIGLDPMQLTPVVTLAIDVRYDQFPDTSSLSILTSGLLGEQYVGLTPGFYDEEEGAFLADGDRVEDTRSAMVLEELIGQFLYSVGQGE